MKQDNDDLEVYGLQKCITSEYRWRYCPSEPECDGAEFESALLEISGILRRFRAEEHLSESDVYVRGDFLRERMQIVDVIEPRALTVSLLQELRHWLIRRGSPCWRVLLPTYTSFNWIILYAQAVFVDGREIDEVPDLDPIRAAMAKCLSENP